jgi:DNA gyrase subunit B
VSYDASNITVLEGLEAVRKRPGMYIGSTGERGLHHLVYEVVDNSVDEALAGYCDTIDVTILADGGVRVRDNGRGIPVDIVESEGKPAVEVVLTVLHAGGKFGGGGYAVSGGLHGVGVSVVNALSSRVEVEVKRDGSVYRMDFAYGAPTAPLRKEGATDETGTIVTFWADGEIFETTHYDFSTLSRRFQEMAFLNKGLTLNLTDEREPDPIDVELDGVNPNEAAPRAVSYHYEGGIADFVKYLNATKGASHQHVIHVESEDTERLISAEVAMQWNSGYSESVYTFANTIHTIEGGTHEEGFRAALTTCVNKFAREWGVLKEKDTNLSGEDIREGLTAIVSVKLGEPQFEGQTKAKLGNTEAKTYVQKLVNEHLGAWFEANPTEGKDIARKAVQASAARIAAARRATSRATARASWAVRAFPASSSTARRPTPTSARSSSSRATRPAARRAAVATRARRRSSRSAARSSTSRRRASTRCCRTTRCRRSSPRSAPVCTTTSTSRSCATARSCSWPTPTSTASTSPRCC